MAEIQFMPCPEEAALIQLLNTVNDTSSIFPAPQIKKKNYWCHPILPGSLRPPGPAES